MSERLPPFELDERRMRAYLLGELPPSERDDVETRVFDSDDDYDRLLDAQYDLIGAYARGTLTPAEREAVEQRLLSHPDGQRRALRARKLSQRGVTMAAPAATMPASAWSPWLAAAAVLLAALTSSLVWMALDNARLKRELAATTAQPVSSPREQPPATSLPPSLIAEMSLVPRVATSAEGTRRVAIAPEAQVVRLQLAVDEVAPAYTVAVERSSAGRLSTERQVAPQADGTLIVWLPADLVRAGNFDVLVWRGEESPANLVATYVFNAVGQ
jgi:hypothetical protein